MTLAQRLDDARVLYANGCYDGALLSVLIAVAATSRRRFSKTIYKSDGHAFIAFLLEENPILIPHSDWIPTTQLDYELAFNPRKSRETGLTCGGWCFKMPGAEESGWARGLVPIATCFYTYVRNSLVHEGTMPDVVEFVQTPIGELLFEVDENALRLSTWMIDQLSTLVTYAPENKDYFPSIAEMPSEVVAWNLFRQNRDKRTAYLTQRADRVRRINGSH